MQAQFLDDQARPLGMTELSILPHVGDTIYLRLHAGVNAVDGSPLPLTAQANFKVVRVVLIAFNNQPTLTWIRPYRDDKDAIAVITVQAANEATAAYMQAIREAYEGEGDEL